jgi:hypothetical protein
MSEGVNGTQGPSRQKNKWQERKRKEVVERKSLTSDGVVLLNVLNGNCWEEMHGQREKG